MQNPRPDSDHPLRAFAPWAVAAVLAVAAAWFASRNFALRNENRGLRSERQLAEVAYKMAQSKLDERSLLAEAMINDLGRQLRRAGDLSRLKVAALAPSAGNPGEAQAIVVWNPEEQTGLLTSGQLPALADTQDYQLWITDPAYPDPVNGGVFHIGADGRVALAFRPDRPVTQAAAFALGVGPKGGGPKAAGPFILRGRP